MNLRVVIGSLLLIVSSFESVHAQSKPKSVTKAYLISAANTVLPIVIATQLNKADEYGLNVPFYAYGFILGPSMGQVYARDVKRAAIGAGLRTAGFVLFARGLAQSISNSSKQGDLEGGLGLLTFVSATVWNIATTPKSVKKYNQTHGLAFEIQPQLGRIGKQPVTGLTATVRF
jgi:hypothetical protein